MVEAPSLRVQSIPMGNSSKVVVWRLRSACPSVISRLESGVTTTNGRHVEIKIAFCDGSPAFAIDALSWLLNNEYEASRKTWGNWT